MTESPDKRVFCKDCKHRRIWQKLGSSCVMPLEGTQCLAQPNIVPHPIWGDVEHYIDCEKRNAGFDCALFEAGVQEEPLREREPWAFEMPPPKPPEQPQFIEFEPAKKPWWRFWS